MNNSVTTLYLMDISAITLIFHADNTSYRERGKDRRAHGSRVTLMLAALFGKHSNSVPNQNERI